MNICILLIEDEVILAHLIARLLKDEGFQVELETDGIAGWNRLTQQSFDLIISDINVPGKNGLEISRDLRLLGVRTPVLLVSGSGAFTLEEVRKVAGADAYLSKPFELSDLLDLTHRLVEPAQQNQGKVYS